MSRTRPVAASTRHTATGLLLLGMAGGLLTGCTRSVEVTPPRHAQACEPATSHWPDRVAHQERRLVKDYGGDPDDARAWGDPAIIATCGWPALGPTSEQCLEVSGVDWVVSPLSDGTKFTTFGTDPAIEVLVPKAYAPEPLVLPAFGPAAQALPTNGRHCT